MISSSERFKICYMYDKSDPDYDIQGLEPIHCIWYKKIGQ